jgi:hypothetical protein
MCEECADREWPGWRDDSSWQAWEPFIDGEGRCDVRNVTDGVYRFLYDEDGQFIEAVPLVS